MVCISAYFLRYSISCCIRGHNNPILEPLYSAPTWVTEAMNSAEPTAWASSFRQDTAFVSSMLVAGNAGLWHGTATSLRSFKNWTLRIYCDRFLCEDNNPRLAHLLWLSTTATALSTSSSDISLSSVSTGSAPAITGSIIMGLGAAEFLAWLLFDV